MLLNDALGRLAWLQGQRWWVVGEEWGQNHPPPPQCQVTTCPGGEKNQTGGARVALLVGGWHRRLILHQSVNQILISFLHSRWDLLSEFVKETLFICRV